MTEKTSEWGTIFFILIIVVVIVLMKVAENHYAKRIEGKKKENAQVPDRD